MTFPEIKLVDAPTATANVLFDFNDLSATPRREVNADGFTIGTPELVGDVDAVDPLYGERSVSFTCAMTGTKPAVAAAQSMLARRLLAGQGWLWVRMTATSRLLFFRTYRAQPGDLSFDLVQSTLSTRPERWELQVNLPCEPFAYGERVTLTSATISNDPASGANPMNIELPAIVGDAPAPLRVALRPNNRLSVNGGRRWMIASHASSSGGAPILWQIGTGDGLSPQTGTGAPVSNVAYSGGSYRPVAFTLPTIQSRIQGAPSPIPSGRYKVLLRVARSDTTTQFTVQFRQDSPVLITYPDAPPGPIVKFDQPSTPAGFAMWLDLGDHQLPFGYNPPADMSNIAAQPIFGIQMGLISGAGSAHLDAILLVPISIDNTVSTSRFLCAQTPNRTTLGEVDGYDVFDGDSETHWKLNTTLTSPVTVDPFPIEGQFPYAVPGADNYLTILNQVDNPNGGDGDKTGATTTAVISYQPRFLYVGDS